MIKEPLCACGCGQVVRYSKWQKYKPRPARYVKGHYNKSNECKTHCKSNGKFLVMARKSHIGKHGLGRMHVGLPNHYHAKKIKVRSPYNEVFIIQNISEWCRKNESIFCPDKEYRFRMPLWERAALALGKLANGKSDQGTAWRGWMAEKWDHTDYLQRNL